MRIAHSILDLIGNTPLLALERYVPGAKVLAKLESFNPLSSAKDRAALYMIRDAEERGVLKPGATIVEPTSGNTGVGLSYIGRILGYRVVLTMPETMSQERRSLLAALGAELVLTEGAKGMGGAIAKAKELLETLPGAWMPDQFNNPANAKAHYETTGPEIWRDTEGKVDVLVAGVGSGGTITGVGEYLRSCRPDVQIVAVEPASSPVLSGGTPGPHAIQGIGAGFVPQALDTGIYDEIIQVEDQDALAMGGRLGRLEGVLVGISSGAAVWPGGRRTGARPSWPCSPTPESTIFPPPCTGTDPVLPPAAGALCSGSRGSFSASSPPALVFCPSPYKIHIFLLSCHWGEQNEPNPDRGRRAGHPGAALRLSPAGRLPDQPGRRRGGGPGAVPLRLL